MEQMNYQDTSINNVDNSISVTNNKIDTLDSNIVNVNTSIGTSNNKLDTLDNSLNGVDSSINTTNTKLYTINSSITDTNGTNYKLDILKEIYNNVNQILTLKIFKRK